MIAAELISRSLRLINEPGRGAILDPDDQGDALTALIEILDSESVSKQFVPGVSRHFFLMTSGKSIYTYGTGSGLDLRSDNFGSLRNGLGDPCPTKIEYCYIRQGAVITANEVVDQFRFESVGSWVVDADPAVAIINDQYKVEQPAGATSTTQLLASVPTVTALTDYVLRVDAVVFNGELVIEARDSAIAFDSVTIDTSGFFEFEFNWPTTVAPDLNLTTALATDDIRLNSLSLIQRGKRDRFELPDSQGSDYSVQIVDQTHYNRRFTKGTGGRP